MEALSKKTTILFPPTLHARLVKLAARQGTSLGDLVRLACEHHYRLMTRDERLEAVWELSDLALPVADPRSMAEESVPDPEDLLP